MEIQKIKVPEADRLLVSAFMCEEYPSEIDFNWLIPVVEKIEEEKYVYVHIEGTECSISINGTQQFVCGYIQGLHLDEARCTKIEATWLAVIEYINFYNQNK